MQALMIGSMVIAPLILVLANVVIARADVALLSLGVAVLWLGGQWQKWPGVNSVALAGVVALGGVTISVGGAAVPVLLALVTAIIAWDLGHLQQQLFTFGQGQPEPLLVKLHLRRLVVVAGLGVIVPLIGQTIQIELTLMWAIVLGGIITVSLSLTINFIRRFGENG